MAESSRIIESRGNGEIAVSDGTPASTRRRSRESKFEEQRSLGRSSSGTSQVGRAFGERRCRGRASRVSRSLAMELAADRVAQRGAARAGRAGQAGRVHRVSQIEIGVSQNEQKRVFLETMVCFELNNSI